MPVYKKTKIRLEFNIFQKSSGTFCGKIYIHLTAVRRLSLGTGKEPDITLSTPTYAFPSTMQPDLHGTKNLVGRSDKSSILPKASSHSNHI